MSFSRWQKCDYDGWLMAGAFFLAIIALGVIGSRFSQLRSTTWPYLPLILKGG